MPNWCNNRVTVFSDDTESVKKIKEIFESKDSVFGKIIEEPDWKRLPNEKGEFPKVKQHFGKDGQLMFETHEFPDGKNDDRWYHWNIQNWGTKWDACHVEIEYYDDSQIEMRFDTAWSPPEPICNRLREMFDDIHISWFYDEPGMEFAGYLQDTLQTVYWGLRSEQPHSIIKVIQTPIMKNGINIELTPSQYDYLYEVIMMAYELEVPEQKGWDMQTYDNMVDNVCNGTSTILSNNVKGVL